MIVTIIVAIIFAIFFLIDRGNYLKENRELQYRLKKKVEKIDYDIEMASMTNEEIKLRNERDARDIHNG